MVMLLLVMIRFSMMFDEGPNSLYSTIVLCNFYFGNLMIVNRSWLPGYAQPCYQD